MNYSKNNLFANAMNSYMKYSFYKRIATLILISIWFLGILATILIFYYNFDSWRTDTKFFASFLSILLNGFSMGFFCCMHEDFISNKWRC